MVDVFTGTLNLTKPEIGGSRDAWGSKWNDNADKIDAAVKANSDAIKNIPPGVPSGAMMYFGMETPPAGWLKCNGASLSRTTYAALFAAIGTRYGAADGNSFSLPDIRGTFLRVLDDGRGIDGGRSTGSYQGDMFGAHSHPPSNSGTYITGYGNGQGGANVASGPYLSIDNSSVQGGSETRPKNFAFPVFMKI